MPKDLGRAVSWLKAYCRTFKDLWVQGLDTGAWQESFRVGCEAKSGIQLQCLWNWKLCIMLQEDHAVMYTSHCLGKENVFTLKQLKYSSKVSSRELQGSFLSKCNATIVGYVADEHRLPVWEFGESVVHENIDVFWDLADSSLYREKARRAKRTVQRILKNVSPLKGWPGELNRRLQAFLIQWWGLQKLSWRMRNPWSKAKRARASWR